MGNNFCRTEGIGTVQLKLHDGTLRDLKKVRYIPKMKNNLIFLSALETSGFIVTIKKGLWHMRLGHPGI